jgi:hypothetical protein
MIRRKTRRTSALSCVQLLFCIHCRGSAPKELEPHEKPASVAQSAASHAIPELARDGPGTAPSALPEAPPVTERKRFCTASFAKGLVVRLRHADGSPLCNGIVSIEEGAYREELSCFLDECAGAGERAGTYTVRATAPGYLPKTMRGIVVEQDREGCHVVRRSVTMGLSRDPAAERTFTSCPPRHSEP